MQAKLVVNDVEVVLGHEELDVISSGLSEHADRSAILYELAKSPSSQVRMNVVYNDAMDKKTAERLIRDSSMEVLRALVQKDKARMIMSDEDMDRLIATADTDLLCHIAEHVDDFVACDLDELCEKLVVQKDPQVRKELASNSGTPREFLENLVDDEDPDVAREAESLLDDYDDEEDDD